MGVWEGGAGRQIARQLGRQIARQVGRQAGGETFFLQTLVKFHSPTPHAAVRSQVAARKRSFHVGQVPLDQLRMRGCVPPSSLRPPVELALLRVVPSVLLPSVLPVAPLAWMPPIIVSLRFLWRRRSSTQLLHRSGPPLARRTPVALYHAAQGLVKAASLADEHHERHVPAGRPEGVLRLGRPEGALSAHSAD